MQHTLGLAELKVSCGIDYTVSDGCPLKKVHVKGSAILCAFDLIPLKW